MNFEHSSQQARPSIEQTPHHSNPAERLQSIRAKSNYAPNPTQKQAVEHLIQMPKHTENFEIALKVVSESSLRNMLSNAENGRGVKGADRMESHLVDLN